MSVGQGLGQGERKLEQAFEGKASVAEQRIEPLALDVLEAEVVLPARVSDLVDGADVGVVQRDTALASRRNRFRRSGSAAISEDRTLTATSRSRRASRARYTSPMPPDPSNRSTSYAPRRSPGDQARGGGRSGSSMKVPACSCEVTTTPPRPAGSGRRRTPHRGTRAVARTFAPGSTGTPTSRAPNALASLVPAGVRGGLTTHPAEEPCARDAPIASDGGRRNTQHIAGFLLRETAEEAQFHDPRLPPIEGGEFREGIVELDDVQAARGGRVHRLVQDDADALPLVLGRRLAWSTRTRRMSVEATAKK